MFKNKFFFIFKLFLKIYNITYIIVILYIYIHTHNIITYYDSVQQLAIHEVYVL